MAFLKAKDASKMDSKSRLDRLKELEMELMKSYAGTQKSTGKTKEIKRAIARIKTFKAGNSAEKRK
mgnify:CR=1 FL=1